MPLGKSSEIAGHSKEQRCGRRERRERWEQ